MTGRYRGVAEQFAHELLSGLRHESRDAPVTVGVGATLAVKTFPRARPRDETARYLVLCERAWLHWSRPALAFVTTRGLQQESLGAFRPDRIRTRTDASAAERRCAVHLRLLDFVTAEIHSADWSWQFETARRVHASTEKTLRIAARAFEVRSSSAHHLAPGISSAADALVAAIHGGFVSDGPAEISRTAVALRRAGAV
jgi:hypothetical protein